jgi:hypothetical protein
VATMACGGTELPVLEPPLAARLAQPLPARPNLPRRPIGLVESEIDRPFSQYGAMESIFKELLPQDVSGSGVVDVRRSEQWVMSSGRGSADGPVLDGVGCDFSWDEATAGREAVATSIFAASTGAVLYRDEVVVLPTGDAVGRFRLDRTLLERPGFGADQVCLRRSADRLDVLVDYRATPSSDLNESLLRYRQEGDLEFLEANPAVIRWVDGNPVSGKVTARWRWGDGGFRQEFEASSGVTKSYCWDQLTEVEHESNVVPPVFPPTCDRWIE